MASTKKTTYSGDKRVQHPVKVLTVPSKKSTKAK